MTRADTLPILDFALWRAERYGAFAGALDAACRDYGFFYLANHGIDPALTRAVFDAAAFFFDRPPAEKAQIAIAASPCHRGWFQLGQEVLNPDTAPQGDYKEGIKIGHECGADHPRVRAGLALHGANQWPDLPDFDGGGAAWRAVMQNYYAAASALARQLMRGFALALGAEQDFFDRWLHEPMATLGPLRYPPQAAGQVGAGAHTDFGCLTLLAQDSLGGLEIETASGAWQAAPPREDCLIVNIGDMMARWTNDRYRSTRHRVQSHPTHIRHALPFFFDPDPDADLRPIADCCAAGESPAYPPATCLSHLLEKIEASFAYRGAD